jgi:hypothetical protein
MIDDDRALSWWLSILGFYDEEGNERDVRVKKNEAN